MRVVAAMRVPGATLAVLAPLLLAACELFGSLTGARVDGIPIGSERTCQQLGLSPARCSRIVLHAKDRLDHLAPGHAEITRVRLYERADPTVEGRPALASDTRVSVAVVVFDLADGHRGAVEIQCGASGVHPEVCDPLLR